VFECLNTTFGEEWPDGGRGCSAAYAAVRGLRSPHKSKSKDAAAELRRAVDISSLFGLRCRTNYSRNSYAYEPQVSHPNHEIFEPASSMSPCE
jgi:hypothetical protein